MQRSEKAKWHMRKRGTVSLERLPDDANTGGKKKDKINCWWSKDTLLISIYSKTPQVGILSRKRINLSFADV